VARKQTNCTEWKVRKGWIAWQESSEFRACMARLIADAVGMTTAILGFLLAILGVSRGLAQGAYQ